MADHRGLRKRSVYIADIRISPAVEAKLAQKHRVSPEEVREAFTLTPLDWAEWVHDAERGWRLIVAGRTYAGRPLNAVLYPVDESDGVWTLATAFQGK